jgi:peptide/nickel transport system ATP-binding protein
VNTRARERRAPQLQIGGRDPFLVVEDLTVEFPTSDGVVHAVAGLSYSLPLGRTLAIVGESGSGKSVASMAVMGLHDRMRTKITGSIKVGGQEVVGMSEARARKLRSAEVAMVFQDPQSSLHPFFQVGDQIAEAYREHHRVSRSVARRRAVEMLDRVGIPNAARRVDDYPHQFSGGMRQRVMIAIGLVNDPKLLIADEPTTALDVTVQAQILDLLVELQNEVGSAIVFITHDLGVVAEIADDVLVMYGGRCVEYGRAHDVLGIPLHPYTWGLLRSVPAVSGEPTRLYPIPGTPPSLLHPPSGCSFHPRCDFKDRVRGDACVRELPELIPRTDDPLRLSRCHLSNPDRIFAEEILPDLP